MNVKPLLTYRVGGGNDQVVKGDGWTGINKPIKVQTAEGDVFVAKSNTQGAFAGIYPDHNTHMDNVREIVASHIVADEFGMPTLTFQQGFLVEGDKRTEKVLSPMRNDFDTLEHASVSSVKDGDKAVGLSILLGWMGDWDSTYNDSNMWVRKDGTLMGADYGYSLKPGISAAGLPFANVKVMKHFATSQNVRAMTDRIAGLSDASIREMVERQGSKWIEDWSPAMSSSMSDALIANRDEIRKDNPYLKYVEGFHPVTRQPLLKMNFPRFWWKAGGGQLPPWNRPDQYLDTLEAIARYGKANRFAKFVHAVRQHVPSPEEKKA